MSISYIVFAYRKFKVNKDKEENSAMSTEILFSVDTEKMSTEPDPALQHGGYISSGFRSNS